MLKTYLVGAALLFVSHKYTCQEDTKESLVIAVTWPILAFGVLVQHIMLGVILGTELGIRACK